LPARRWSPRPSFVAPAKAGAKLGVVMTCINLDPGLRRDDLSIGALCATRVRKLH